MNWLILSLICVLGWGFADVFYKISAEEQDALSHLKTAVWVGLVMGLTSIFLLPLSESGITEGNFFRSLLLYSPASLGYILSMIIGYAGLRYLELSIVSPVQNASGALTVLALMLFYFLAGLPEKIEETFGIAEIIGTILILLGVLSLGVVEQKKSREEEKAAGRLMEKTSAGLACMPEDDPAGEISSESSNIPEAISADRRYTRGALALLFPVLYCVFDTIGTAADGVILDPDLGLGLGEFDVLILYGLTFFMAGLVCYVLLWAKTGSPYRLFQKKELPKLAAAVCEEFGQIFYVFAMASNPMLVAPVVASYCILSVVLSRIILGEKLEKRQWACVLTVILGIVLLGIAEGLAG